MLGVYSLGEKWMHKRNFLRKFADCKNVFYYVQIIQTQGKEQAIYKKEGSLFVGYTRCHSRAFRSDLHFGVQKNERLCLGSHIGKYKEHHLVPEIIGYNRGV